MLWWWTKVPTIRTHPAYSPERPVPISDVADARLQEAVAALREFVDQRGRLPTAESWTEAAMRPSEKTIRRQFGSFREAIQRAGLSLD